MLRECPVELSPKRLKHSKAWQAVTLELFAQFHFLHLACGSQGNGL
ncbi:MAG: hypothetical protein RJA09_1443, partial [Pseudomonadota bacterium]